nr:ATP-binding protein [Acinetobacter nosocomialis]
MSGPLLDRIDLHIGVTRMTRWSCGRVRRWVSPVLRYAHGWKPPTPGSRRVARSMRICRQRRCGRARS